MHVLALLPLLPLALARRPAQVIPRTVAVVEADIATVSTDLTAFDKAITKFTGTTLQALSLLSSYNTLADAITTATSDIADNGALAAADSATVYASVAGLTTQITATLADAVAKYSVVASAGYASDVCTALSGLLTDSDAFYEALEAEIYSTYTSELTTLQSTADTAFASTIVTYGC